MDLKEIATHKELEDELMGEAGMDVQTAHRTANWYLSEEKNKPDSSDLEAMG